MKYYAIIVAGGKGSRMKSKVPKQFMLLDGKPVLIHSMENFRKANPKTVIIIVLPIEEFSRWGKLLKKYPFYNHLLVEGGKTRFHSVQNGLEAISEDGIVAVHDGARPLASIQLIKQCYKEAAKKGSAVLCIPANESLRKVKGKKNKIVNRNSIVVIQTPQCFDAKTLKKAYRTKYKDEFTDDASVVERLGKKIHLVTGEKENIKITTADDLLIAQALLRKK
jgi:2-C-methyl-D-erythritol 4-phosphate cytidylyltransferase